MDCLFEAIMRIVMTTARESACTRCQGRLVDEWDHDARAQIQRCLNCGNRPQMVTYRIDGQPLGSPLLCVACHARPRAIITVGVRRGDEIAVCEACSRGRSSSG